VTTRGALLGVTGGAVTRAAVFGARAPSEVAGLAEAGGGALWLAGSNGVLRFAGGAVESALAPDGAPLSAAAAFAILPDARGRLWVATERGLLRLAEEGRREFTRRDGLPTDLVSALAEGPAGELWVGTSLGLARIDGERVTPVGGALAGQWIRCLAHDRDGNLWIGTRGRGIFRLREGRLDPLDATGGLPNDLVRQIYEDRDGALWVATAGGLARLTDGPVTTWTLPQGLPSRFVWAVHEDARGTLWIGTSGGGVARLLPDGRVAPPPFADPGLIGVEIRAFLTARDGTLWIGTGGNGLATVRHGRVEWLPLGDTPAARWIFCLLEDRAGAIWAGTGDGLLRVEEGGPAVRFRRRGPGQNIVRSLAERPGGGLWVGMLDGLAEIRDDALLPVGAAGALDGARIHSFAVEPVGGLWMATDGGLARLAAERIERWTTAEGLPIDMTYWLVDDGDGNLWVSTDLGLLRLPKVQVDELARGARQRLEPLLLGRGDGMLATECNSGAPAGVRRADGTFCFATTDGVSCVDPVRVRALEAAPPVEITAVSVDGRAAPVVAGAPPPAVVVPRGARRVELRYAAVALVGAERVTFRYRLEGFDESWIDAGGATAAQLTGLPAGRYRFAVAARRGGAAWSEPARLGLEIEPALHQTTPFALGVLAAVGLVATGAVRLRTRQLARRARLLAVQVEERTAELARANADLERLSLADGLTRIANRRHFDARLDAEWRRAARTAMPLALILADLDHFKAYNDAHGHLAGDDCLKRVTRTLGAEVKRADDLVARYGGEEIAILLPGCELAEAQALAERLRAAVEELDLRHERSPFGRVTLSAGVAARVPEPHSQPELLIDEADRALYRAKHAGRNQVAR
jgi:diguanylate cyclase (GGDEF)-like protein